MSDQTRLTRDASRLLALMYRRYLTSVADGVPRREARSFGDSPTIRALFLPDWDLEDVDDLLRELAAAGFLSVRFADNIVCECALTPSCVSRMENQFPDGLKEVAHFLLNLKELFA